MCDGTATRLHQTWDGGDGKTWIDVPCEWPDGRYLCWTHKIESMRETAGTSVQVPEHFKGEQTQRELANEIFSAARRNGTELQRM